MTSFLRDDGNFNDNWLKTAAKDKMPRKAVSKALEKARDTYSKHKKYHDQVAKEHAKLTSDLNEAKDGLLKTRKHLARLTKAQQTADIADASDVIFHPDSEDVSYIIDGKECHVTMDDVGEVQVTPWREFQRGKKTPISVDPPEPDTHPEESAQSDDGWAWDEAAVDDLYSELIV